MSAIPTTDENAKSQGIASTEDDSMISLLSRSGIGGVLMGLANLVPGISGGTMLLAVGIYPNFIGAIAEVSTFKFKKRSILTLGAVVAAALVSILLFAGPVKNLVVDHRWIMYSLFIGLTLGGVPIVWKLAKPANGGVWGGFLFGFAAMAALAIMQSSQGGDAAQNSGWMMMFVAGLAGAGAMILPGVSGGYLLLVLGVYVPILSGIDALKTALKAKDISAAMTPLMDVVIPVGLGVAVGVLVVSNLLKLLLEKAEKPTLGALLGLLVGAVVGLWPFQHGVAPKIGSMFKGQIVTAESLKAISPEKFPTEFFSPSATQIAGAVALILVGFALTAFLAKVGERKEA